MVTVGADLGVGRREAAGNGKGFLIARSPSRPAGSRWQAASSGGLNQATAEFLDDQAQVVGSPRLSAAPLQGAMARARACFVGRGHGSMVGGSNGMIELNQ